MNEEAEDCNCPPEGLPQYMGTFADLMALLMCFFVLLLSFAEMDVLKFKQVAGALKLAFGVQRDVIATEIPKGTSVIAQQPPSRTTREELSRHRRDLVSNCDHNMLCGRKRRHVIF